MRNCCENSWRHSSITFSIIFLQESVANFCWRDEFFATPLEGIPIHRNFWNQVWNISQNDSGKNCWRIAGGTTEYKPWSLILFPMNFYKNSVETSERSLKEIFWKTFDWFYGRTVSQKTSPKNFSKKSRRTSESIIGIYLNKNSEQRSEKCQD